MENDLFIEAISKFLLGVVLVGLLLFWPAGTLLYPQGILFMALLFLPMFAAGLVMLAKDKNLLRSRLDAKEKLNGQSLIIKLSGLMFLAGFIAAGLSFRYDFMTLPWPVSLAAAGLFLLAYGMYGEVLRENAYLSRTIEVQEGQTVVDTGLYAIVRHPMYTATILLFLSMPLVLGSLLSFILFLPYPLLIAARLKGEEAFLEKELEGYAEYKKKVRWRLLPFIW